MSESQACRVARLCLQRMLVRMEHAEEELGRLDAAAGDGDHGAGMVRGLRAANAALPLAENDGCFPGSLLEQAGDAFADAAGGASGALVGGLIAGVGRALGDGPLAAETVHAALAAGLDLVCQMGQAKPGDKTLVDTLAPFVSALEQGGRAGLALADAWRQALPAAESGTLATASMISRRGRAARLGERSRGHLDPGAVSMLYLLQAVGEVLAQEQAGA